MKTLLLSIGLLVLGLAGLAIKLLVKKNGQFTGTCASNSPFLNKTGDSCSLCGAKPNEQCKNDNLPRKVLTDKPLTA